MISSIKHYSELSLDEFHDIIALRISVFVIEQNCPYQELDGRDKDAWHLTLEDKGNIVGTLRILKPGVVYPDVSIGRVVSATSQRGKGLGHRMMKDAMIFIEAKFGKINVRISAQSHLAKFYENHGFHKTRKEYLEDGIPHSEMLFTP